MRGRGRDTGQALSGAGEHRGQVHQSLASGSSAAKQGAQEPGSKGHRPCWSLESGEAWILWKVLDGGSEARGRELETLGRKKLSDLKAL